jgi:hypothetical protein
MKEKSKAKGLSEGKLIPDRKTGAIYTSLTCGFGNFEGATGSAVTSLFKPLERDIKIHLFFIQNVAYQKTNSRIYLLFLDNLGLHKTIYLSYFIQ